MQLETRPTPRIARGVLISLVFHGALFTGLLLIGILPGLRFLDPVHSSAKVFIPISEIKIAGASHAIKLILPPDPAAANTKTPDRNTSPTKKTILPEPQTQPKKYGGGSPPNPQDSKGSGTVKAGNGPDDEDATPAFPTFSPKPPVRDRALLPASEKKIIVDVNVDEQGGVVSETLVTGLGNRLDQIVLDTVKSWRFQPATVNGKPVATQAELVFPFNPQYPISDS